MAVLQRSACFLSASGGAEGKLQTRDEWENPMLRMPSKLLEMIQQGVAEEGEIQLILAALKGAERSAKCFVNVYRSEETSFSFTNDARQADRQLRDWIERTGRLVIGFTNSGGTWELRAPSAHA